MGSQISSAMQEGQDRMFERQTAAQQRMMERQIEVQRQMVGKQMAMNIARQRDMFHFYSAFAVPAVTLLLIGGMKKKSPAMFAPILPLSVAWAYQYDMAYNHKLDRLRAQAEVILAEHPELVALPGPWPTIESVDRTIDKAKRDAAHIV